MPRSWRPDECGQTEPIPALVAVAAVCLGVSLYAGYAANALPGTSDRAVEETTLDTVWTDLGDDGLYDPNADALETLSSETLPDGYHVRVTISVEDVRGEQRIVDRVRIDAHGDDDPGLPPDGARTASRSIPVIDEELPGDVDVGTLSVEVWE
ncbi:DUF7285 family protein [Natranaeroarchaeum aerophilus]|uniref:Uncharacterized protein n=1 Tax=Natranaeroarchaeum aerophilus TaxID=2917711 RepID=A0AAE3FSV2_9EURY|nr:hypothetical protein [Natranaeroarchaeum aerophilus]